jgi:hypothetical protein
MFTQAARPATFQCEGGNVACLINAINEANANGQINTIMLQPGTYNLTTIDNQSDGPNGLPSVASILTIRRLDAAVGAVDLLRETSAPMFRLLHIAKTGNLTLEGVNVRGGRSPGISSRGGGIYNNGSFTVSQATVSGNFATESGGGIFNNAGIVEITQSVIADNSVVELGFFGGGLANIGGRVRVARSTFAGNGSVEDGALATDGGLVAIIDSRFTSNAGGLLVEGGTVQVRGSTFDHNSGEIMGAIRVLDTGQTDVPKLTVLDSSFTENIAQFQVGAGIVNDGGQVVIRNSTFTKNTVARGAQTGVIANRAGSLTLFDSTVAQNNSVVPGFPPVPALVSAPTAKTIFKNSIVADNSQDCAGAVESLGYNVIGNIAGCGILLQTTDLTGDAGLGPFVDNGKPGNGHLPLLPTSQAIDRGTPDLCLSRDQIGQRRRGRCDIGAIEFVEGDHE